MATNAGIDYGCGTTNIDAATGIRYGVISMHSINLDCTNDFKYDYGKPHCPKCGNEIGESSDANARNHPYPVALSITHKRRSDA